MTGTRTAYSLFVPFAISVNHFMQRPLRDSMAAFCGAEYLNWLMTATLLATLCLSLLLLHLEKKYNPGKAIPYLLLFTAVVQLVMYQKLESPTFGWALFYFSFTSTTSLTLLSLAWRKIAASHTPQQTIPLYMATNLGAIAGPIIILIVSKTIGTLMVLPLSSFLLVSIAFIFLNIKDEEQTEWQNETLCMPRFPFKRISFFILLYTLTATGFYFFMIKTVSSQLVAADRITLFTIIDLVINSLVVLLPLLMRKLIVKPVAFLLVPCLSLLLMMFLGFQITMLTAIMAIVIFKVSNLSVQRPARELLLLGSTLALPYGTKNFLDTAVYRLGDTLGSWGIVLLLSSGTSLHQIALLLIPFIILWIITGHSISKNVKLMTST